MAEEIVENLTEAQIKERAEEALLAEAEKVLLEGATVIPAVDPKDRLTILQGVIRGAEQRVQLIRIQYAVAKAADVTVDLKNVKKETAEQIRIHKYATAQIAELKKTIGVT